MTTIVEIDYRNQQKEVTYQLTEAHQKVSE